MSQEFFSITYAANSTAEKKKTRVYYVSESIVTFLDLV